MIEILNTFFTGNIFIGMIANLINPEALSILELSFSDKYLSKSSQATDKDNCHFVVVFVGGKNISCRIAKDKAISLTLYSNISNCGDNLIFSNASNFFLTNFPPA